MQLGVTDCWKGPVGDITLELYRNWNSSRSFKSRVLYTRSTQEVEEKFGLDITKQRIHK